MGKQVRQRELTMGWVEWGCFQQLESSISEGGPSDASLSICPLEDLRGAGSCLAGSSSQMPGQMEMQNLPSTLMGAQTQATGRSVCCEPRASRGMRISERPGGW